MNSDGWQKCFTNVPPGASRGSADHNVKNVFSGICDADSRRFVFAFYGGAVVYLAHEKLQEHSGQIDLLIRLSFCWLFPCR